MLIMAGGGNGKPLNYDELERWTRVGYDRRTRSRKGEQRTCLRRGNADVLSRAGQSMITRAAESDPATFSRFGLGACRG